MQVRIDNASSRPVYQQIMDQIKRDIALGRLAWDEKLPTVRQLAAQLAINPNTIAKAYRQLEREGIITTRPGAGAFVASLDSSLSRAVKKRLVSAELERIAVEAFHMQIDTQSLRQWFDDAVERFNLPPGKPSPQVPKGGQSNE
jgi:GntR family transcriptional regulator